MLYTIHVGTVVVCVFANSNMWPVSAADNIIRKQQNVPLTT